MKRFFAITILIIISFILQTTVFKWIAFGGIVPNLLVILTASYGIFRGDKSGVIVGFVCGLLCDIFFGSFLGLNAIFYMIIGYFNGKFNDAFYKDDIKLPIILVVSSDFIYGLMYYLFLFLLRGRFDFSYYFAKIILPEMIYTVVISLAYYPLLLFINNWLEKNKYGRGMKFV